MTTKVFFEDVKRDHLFIDVRSPKEYQHDTIPGAINMPLFTDEQRESVGITYVQISREEAKRMGAVMVAPKLPKMLDQLMELKKQNKKIVCFCEKGGYRSTFFTSVFNSIDIFLLQLDGGYKGYRKMVRQQIAALNEQVNYVVLHGNTGTGKTEILHALKQLGYDILDLEDAANHRGSLLGGIGIGECNSQKRFESLLYQQLDHRKSNIIFVEAESKRIGNIIIPDEIFLKMKLGTHIKIDASIPNRLNILRNDYTLKDKWQKEALEALSYIEKYISKKRFHNLADWINSGDFDSAATDLMLNYYDPMYSHTDKNINYEYLFLNEKCSMDTAKEILNKLKL